MKKEGEEKSKKEEGKGSVAERELLQGDQCSEAAGAASFGAVGIPILRVAGGTDARDFDLTNPSMFEGVPVGFP